VARFRPKGVGLERVLETRALAGTAYGDVGSSIYYALGLVAVFALGLTPIAYLIAGVIFVMTAMTYAEATANFPEAGGASSFARRAFNESASFLAGWAQILNYVITVSISAFFVPHYLAVFWEPLRHNPGDILAGIAIVLTLSAVNIIGVRDSARLNIFLAAIDFGTQLFLMILGFVLVLNFTTLVHNIHLGVAPSWGDFAIAIPIAMISYTGMETISNMSEEAKMPRLLVPRAYKVLVVAVLVMSAGIPAVALSAMPVSHVGGHFTTALSDTYAADPILGIVKSMHLGMFATPMQYYVGILAATILLVASNAGIIGVSRLTYSMGQYQMLPERLRQVGARSRTPGVAIAVFAVIACLAIVPGQATFLGTLYSFGAMLSFTTAHVALIGLRWRLSRNKMRKLPGDVEVEEEAPWYRAPLNVRVRGIDVPLFAVIGGLATAGSWFTVMALYHQALYAGFAWLLLGAITYVGYRRHKGLSLTETKKLKFQPALGIEPVKYPSVIVAFEEPTFSETAMSTALKLASHRGGDVRVMVTLEVPSHLEIGASLGGAEAEAQQVVEAGRQWAHRGQRVHGKIVRVRSGEAGHRIVREAKEAKASAIVMAMPRHRPSGKLLNKTLEVVLGKRPCRVIIDSAPAKLLVEHEQGSEVASPSAQKVGTWDKRDSLGSPRATP
jgi:APA family basic amino acid/polyamine antiporter